MLPGDGQPDTGPFFTALKNLGRTDGNLGRNSKEIHEIYLFENHIYLRSPELS